MSNISQISDGTSGRARRISTSAGSTAIADALERPSKQGQTTQDERARFG